LVRRAFATTVVAPIVRSWPLAAISTRAPAAGSPNGPPNRAVVEGMIQDDSIQPRRTLLNVGVVRDQDEGGVVVSRA
jgi:hypothetical protein